MNETESRIVIVDLRVPFLRLVFFFVKAALAMIPATIILMLVFAFIAGMVASIIGPGFFDFVMGRHTI